MIRPPHGSAVGAGGPPPGAEAVREALGAVGSWPAAASAGAVVPGGGGATVTAGAADRPFAWASVTKVLTAMAIWVAVEEGTVTWDDPAGPPGATLVHLLAHASGLAPDSDAVLAPPGTRRIYSNRGIEIAAAHLEAAAGMPFVEYLAAAILEPLDMTTTELRGSPAAGAWGTLSDLLALGRQLLSPTVVHRSTLAHATSPAFPGLAGVLPGFGRQDPNDWGLGVEIRGHKAPHWTGRCNSPATFGHFGQAGGFLWVDPAAGVALASLGERPFGPWAADAWPALSDAVLAAGLTTREDRPAP